MELPEDFVAELRRCLNKVHVRGQNHKTGQHIITDDILSDLKNLVECAIDAHQSDEAARSAALGEVWRKTALAWKEVAENLAELIDKKIKTARQETIGDA